jgi:mono/diheme cytochrome c family protein
MSRIVTVLAVALALNAAFAQPPGQRVDFVRDVQPILERSCHRCHGAAMQMGRLRLDARHTALGGGQSGPIILAGRSSESLLWKRITGATEPRMPMGGEPLSAADIATIAAWIDQGAEWPESPGATVTASGLDAKRHWAFVAPVRPPVPQVRRPRPWRNAPENPIDAFILARIEKLRLSPSPEADRITLLRRLSLDLVGLPPAPEEVDAFVRDRRPDAYVRQVERLLASPHYGERWGRHWLDAARYADSDGYEKDKQRQVWFYRDWVIGALNRDLPWDRFVIEQIAGDLLPGATQDQHVATGFLRNSMINEEGGVDPEQFRMEAMFDRMDAIGKGILGITIQCAQCHTHKYDPLTHEEYYRMFAFLNNAHEANIPVYTPADEMKRAEIFRAVRAIESDLQHRNPDWAERMRRWEAEVSKGLPEWKVVRPTVDDISTGGQRYLPLPDGSLLAQGYAPTKHRVKLTVRTDVQNITAFRLELLTDPNLPLGGPGRSIKGTGALTEFEVEATPAQEVANGGDADPVADATAAPDAKPVKVKIARATADLELPETPLEAMFYDKTERRRVTGPAAFATDGREETAWGIDAGPGRRNQPRHAVFQAVEPISNPGGTVLTFYLRQAHGGWNSDDNQNCNLGRIRLSITSTPGAAADPVPAAVREILAVPEGDRTPAQVQTVFGHFRTTVPEWRENNLAIEKLWQQHPEGSSQLVLAERTVPRATHRLERGDFLKPVSLVAPGVPAFLHPLAAGQAPPRLQFAQWLVDRRSPTTARSIVNRVWQAYFGTGLVATADDLGTQSEPPSHPELLDWLAVELMDRGWSLKGLHRLIVTSATYRQSSRVTPELLSRDPNNRLLARGPRFRVEAEVVRDSALAASGLLDARVGGPSVYPPAPDFLFVPPASYGPKIWNESTGRDRYRRALYTFRYRSVPFPMLHTFDAPNGDTSCVRRTRSNTPLQALATLNEPVSVEAARALALRALREGSRSESDRLALAFRLCVARKPTRQEMAELRGLLRRQTERLREGWVGARELAGLDGADTPGLPSGVTPVDVAAWTAVARVILNLDETITKE